MIVHYSEPIKKKCWNLYDIYGEICVHCGCCSINPKARYTARIKCLERWQAENAAFDMWAEDPELCEVQKRNVKLNDKHYKRMLCYYRKKLREVS